MDVLKRIRIEGQRYFVIGESQSQHPVNLNVRGYKVRLFNGDEFSSIYPHDFTISSLKEMQEALLRKPTLDSFGLDPLLKGSEIIYPVRTINYIAPQTELGLLPAA